MSKKISEPFTPPTEPTERPEEIEFPEEDSKDIDLEPNELIEGNEYENEHKVCVVYGDKIQEIGNIRICQSREDLLVKNLNIGELFPVGNRSVVIGNFIISIQRSRAKITSSGSGYYERNISFKDLGEQYIDFVSIRFIVNNKSRRPITRDCPKIRIGHHDYDSYPPQAAFEATSEEMIDLGWEIVENVWIKKNPGLGVEDFYLALFKKVGLQNVIEMDSWQEELREVQGWRQLLGEYAQENGIKIDFQGERHMLVDGELIDLLSIK